MRISPRKDTFAIRSGLMWLIFGIFLLNALGVLHFSVFEAAGLQFHTNLLSSLLVEQHLPPALQKMDFVIFLICGAALCFALPKASPIAASAITLGATAVTFFVAYKQAANNGVVPLEFTLLTLLILFTVNVLFGYFVETHEKQKIIDMFGQFVPPAVVDTIASQPEQLNLNGEARELSVMFCDIKHFSTMSERLEPTELADLLNVYFTEMTDVLRDHGATIDKYIGDAIMAFWGAPIHRTAHAAESLEAARAMLGTLPKLRDIFSRRGWPHLDVGIGINTGFMNVGNMGSRYRLAYTVIGDAVNLAARYEALTRLYGTQIIVGEATRVANPNLIFRELDYVRVKGKGIATRLYEPLFSLQGVSNELLSEHQRALNAYYAADWDNAEKAFTKLHHSAENPVYYLLMIDRIREYRITQGTNFDGITSFTR
ncbi:MAG: adenylate/guanylate cyclase domain-containing protein [Gammaproteobacteria bacterium]